MKRLVNTNHKNLDKSYIFPQNEKFSRKPRGLWYSIGSEWIDYCNSANPDAIKDRMMELNLAVKKILIIKTINDLVGFQNTYRANLPENVRDWINWNEVSKHYSGIEFRNFKEIYEALDWGQMCSMLWFCQLDCSSGCVWDLSAIRSYTSRELLPTDFSDTLQKEQNKPAPVKDDITYPYIEYRDGMRYVHETKYKMSIHPMSQIEKRIQETIIHPTDDLIV